MASPGNQHCANCIGTLSFRVVRCVSTVRLFCQVPTCSHHAQKKPPLPISSPDLSHHRAASTGHEAGGSVVG